MSESTRIWLRQLQEAKSLVLEARNGGLRYIDRGGALGEAAEKIDAMYWDIEYVIGVVMVELRSVSD